MERDHDRGLASYIRSLAALIDRPQFPTGQRAALRRMDPEQPPPLAFYALAAMGHLAPGWDRDEETRKNWVTIVAGLALTSPGGHMPAVSLGTALGEAKFHELRLDRLLSSEGAVRRSLLLRAVRFLLTKGQAFNWVDAAMLLLSTGTTQENLRRRIAQDYYRTLSKSDDPSVINVS